MIKIKSDPSALAGKIVATTIAIFMIWSAASFYVYWGLDGLAINRTGDIKNGPLIISQLVRDVTPITGEESKKVMFSFVDKDEIKDLCIKNGDEDVYKKMMQHELTQEPAGGVVVFSQKDGTKLEKKYFNKILIDLGYNVGVLFSKSHGDNYEAETNINGYSLVGWKSMVNFFDRVDPNLYILFGKQFAPGFSRMHLRIFEGEKVWYVVAHIDVINWSNLQNLGGILDSHLGSGHGDYADGTSYFIESLKYYFSNQ